MEKMKNVKTKSAFMPKKFIETKWKHRQHNYTNKIHTPLLLPLLLPVF